MKIRMTASLFLLMFLVILQSGCTSEDASTSTVQAATEVRGDTTFVRIPADVALPVDTAAIEIVFRSDSLERPSGIVRIGSRLVVADGVRLHVLSNDFALLATTGRSGKGPGEFGSIMALGTIGDTVVVLDARLLRLSYYDSTGSYLGSIPVPPTPPFVNPRRGSSRLQPFDGGLLYQATENVHLERPTQAAILWRSLQDGSVETVRSWDDIDWMNTGRMLAPKELFGPRAHLAIGSDGLYAHGDGVEYCVDIERVKSQAVRRICRAWKRVPTTGAVTSPDIGEIERHGLEGVRAEGLLVALRQIHVGDAWPAYDRLMLDEANRLWVRRIGPEQAVSHPSFWHYFEDMRPSHFAWDVYEPTGTPVRTVVFPNNFEPQLVEPGRAFGILELGSGELTFAEATW